MKKLQPGNKVDYFGSEHIIAENENIGDPNKLQTSAYLLGTIELKALELANEILQKIEDMAGH